MAVTVKKLYKNGSFLYKMKLIAGQNGLSNLVKWVHIIEDNAVSSFLHGNELVFTAGILNDSEDWLLNFVHGLQNANASAFVVNIGPYTKEVPAEVIDYCNKIGMPLFTIPWETKMVDMTRDFCYRIMRNENTESNIASTIKNIIFNIGDFDTQVMQMERYGYQRNSTFCFISVAVNNKKSISFASYMDSIELIAEKIAKSMHELFISFSYKEFLNFVLVNYSDAEIEEFVEKFLRLAKNALEGFSVHIGISSNQTGIYNQNMNFEKALSALEMAVNKDEKVCSYDKMGIYKVLYSVNDKSVLRNYYNETLGKLEAYDRENQTQLTQLLQTYLENNGSLQLVSEKMYIHRNTVTNQLNKIEKITGYDPMDLEHKVKLYIGMYIKDIL